MRIPRRRVLIGIVFGAVAVGLLLWLRTDDDSDRAAETKTQTTGSVAGLKGLLRSVDHAVYWAGPRKGHTYELTRKDSEIYIRYLPSGVQAGEQRSDFLTVGTYPYHDSFGYLQDAVDRGRAIQLISGRLPPSVASGGLVTYRKSSPQSMFFASPQSDYLIEVYDRSSSRARRLATSGRVRPIDR